MTDSAQEWLEVIRVLVITGVVSIVLSCSVVQQLTPSTVGRAFDTFFFRSTSLIIMLYTLY